MSWRAFLAAAVVASAAPRAVVDASYPEGPLWTQGALWYTEYGGHRVVAWDGKASRVVWACPGEGPCGLAEAPGGDVWVTCYDTNRLVRLDPAGHVVSSVATDDQGHALAGPNDLVVDAHGGVYFTTSGVFEAAAPVAGRIFYVAPGGRPHEVAAGLHYANGVAIADGGKALLVCETLRHQVTRYDVGPGGTLSNGRPFLVLAPYVPPRRPPGPALGPRRPQGGPARGGLRPDLRRRPRPGLRLDGRPAREPGPARALRDERGPGR